MELKETLVKSLTYKNTSEKLVELDNEKKLEKIISQVSEMKEVGECKYHVVNCFDHSIKSLEEFECLIKEDNFFSEHLKDMIWQYLNTSVQEDLTRLDILKLGIFLHDVGKPQSKTIDENGRVHFKGHEVIGGDIVKKLGKQLNLSDFATKTLFNYVRYHMILLVFYKRNNLTQDNLFDIFEKIGEDIIGIMLLGYADIVATRKLLNPDEQVGTIKIYMEFILTNYEYRYKKLK
ncbi:MAG: HD domain-containing protein [Peptostreptococcaceae bacterium]